MMPERGRPSCRIGIEFVVSNGLVGSTLEQEPDEIGVAKISRQVRAGGSVLQAHVDVEAKIQQILDDCKLPVRAGISEGAFERTH